MGIVGKTISRYIAVSICLGFILTCVLTGLYHIVHRTSSFMYDTMGLTDDNNDR